MANSLQQTPAADRPVDDEVGQFDAIIIGGGITGLYQLYRLRQLGLSVRLFEDGGGVGGTWYWNRYPDVVSTPRVTPTHIRSQKNYYRNGTGRNSFPVSLRTNATSTTSRTSLTCAGTSNSIRHVVSAVYDEAENRWQVQTEDGRLARAQFLITAVGVLSAHYVPDFEGLDSFKGDWCHTGKWPKEGMNLAGKRVGVIGTGATGVQLIPEIAKGGRSSDRLSAHCQLLCAAPQYLDRPRWMAPGSRQATRKSSRNVTSPQTPWPRIRPAVGYGSIIGRTAGEVRRVVGGAWFQEIPVQFP